MRTKRERDLLPGETECSAHKHIHRLAVSSYDRIVAIGGEDVICKLILPKSTKIKVLHRKPLLVGKPTEGGGVMVGPEAPEEWPTQAPIFDVIGELSEFFEARVSWLVTTLTRQIRDFSISPSLSYQIHLSCTSSRGTKSKQS